MVDAVRVSRWILSVAIVSAADVADPTTEMSLTVMVPGSAGTGVSLTVTPQVAV